MHGGMSTAECATTNVGVMRLRGTFPCSPQSSHMSTSLECDSPINSNMALDLQSAHQRAQQYSGTTANLVRLGWGVSGFVYLSADGRSAIKIHRTTEQFATEKRAYLILGRYGITSICGLTVPKMRDYSDELQAIRMDFVSAPYLLDFAGVLFTPPDFTEEVLSDWHDRIDDRFGANAWLAHAVFHHLQRIGLYYLDFSPSNLNVKGHPDCQDL